MKLAYITPYHATAYKFPQGQTHTHANTQTKAISRNQVRAAFGHAPGLIKSVSYINFNSLVKLTKIFIKQSYTRS